MGVHCELAFSGFFEMTKDQDLCASLTGPPPTLHLSRSSSNTLSTSLSNNTDNLVLLTFYYTPLSGLQVKPEFMSTIENLKSFGM